MEEQREQLLGQVREEVEKYRQDLTAKVRAEVDQLQNRWSEAIHDERESFLRDLRHRAAEEICAIARRALADLAGAELERCIVSSFLKRVEHPDDHEREEIAASLQKEGGAVRVQTSFDLPPDLQESVADRLRRLSRLQDVRFEVSPDVTCGITLQTNSHRQAWELGDYVRSLEQQVQQTLDEEAMDRKPVA